MARRSRGRRRRGGRKGQALLCNPNELSCFLKERNGKASVGDPAHFHLNWDLKAFTYTIQEDNTIRTLPNGSLVYDELQLGIRKIKQASCCCYRITDQTWCFYITTFLSFVLHAALAIFIAIKSEYDAQIIILSSLGLLSLWVALQGLFILIWYIFNIIRAWLIRRRLQSMNRDPHNEGWLTWSCSPLATRISIFFKDFTQLRSPKLEGGRNAAEKTDLGQDEKKESQIFSGNRIVLEDI